LRSLISSSGRSFVSNSFFSYAGFYVCEYACAYCG